MTRRRFIGSAAVMLTSAGLAETSVDSFLHTFDKEYFIVAISKVYCLKT